jgi:archaellum biogenesis ATPase FlaH
MDVEQGVICKAIQMADITALYNANIKLAYFQDDEHREVYRWMLEYWDRYSASPTRDALKHEYPDYEYTELGEPYDYYINEMLKERRYHIIHDGIDAAIPVMNANDPDGAMKFLIEAIERIHQEIPSGVQEDICATTKERRMAYNDINLRKGLLGITSGFANIDRATSGLQKSQLVTMFGMPKTGKSVILMHMAIASHQAGYRPLLVSFEMSNFEQSSRHDAFQAGISHHRLINGKLRQREKVKLDRMLKGLEDMQPFTLVHDPGSTTTVAGLASKISEVKPDIVFVDGTYMMQCDDTRLDPTTPQGLTSITRSMKRLAQRAKLPIVQTTQGLAWKYSRRRGLQLDTIGYSSSFAQDSDVILGVEDVENAPMDFLVKIVAARHASKRTILISLDWDHGSIIESETEDEPEEEEDDEQFDG